MITTVTKYGKFGDIVKDPASTVFRPLKFKGESTPGAKKQVPGKPSDQSVFTEAEYEAIPGVFPLNISAGEIRKVELSNAIDFVIEVPAGSNNPVYLNFQESNSKAVAIGVGQSRTFSPGNSTYLYNNPIYIFAELETECLVFVNNRGKKL